MDLLGLGLLAAAICAGQLAVAAPFEVVAAVLVVAAMLVTFHRRPWLALGVCAAAALSWGRAQRAVTAYEEARAGVLVNGPQAFAGLVVVTSSPVETHGTIRFHARPEAEGARALDLLLYGGPADVARGDRLDVTAHVSLPERFWNVELGDPRPPAARAGTVLSGGTETVRRIARGHGLGAFIDRARAAVRRRIEATFAADEAPLARALVLGEDDLAPEEEAAFRTSGLSHLLAVSGMHLVLVVAGTLAVLRALLVRVGPLAERVDVGRLVAATGPPLAFVYASFAGGSGSALRAAWMASLVEVARVSGRRAEAPRALALSAVAMALADPLVAFDVSFTLSVAATLGLLALAPRIHAFLQTTLGAIAGPARRERLASLPLAPAALRALAATFAASIACAPILAGFAPTLPLGGALANLLAVPLGETAALPICLAHAFLAPWPDAERGAALAAGTALAWLRTLATTFAAHANVATVRPTSVELSLAAAVVAVMALGPARGRRFVALVGVGLVALAEMIVRVRGAPEGELRVTFLDVGQGDSALVDLPDGRALLVDGGGLVGSPVDLGARVLLPVLRARRRTELAAVVLTHPHPDHFLGLVTLLAPASPGTPGAIHVDELWDTGQGGRESMGGGYAQLLAEARAASLPVQRPDSLCGVHHLGGVELEVLEPCPDVDGDHDPNDNSFVLRLTYGRRRFLFVGDAERAEEQRLLATGADLHADVLKVGHHGSRTSTSPEFLAVVHPEIAVISSGVRNRFGHPHPNTLATLAAAGFTDRLVGGLARGPVFRRTDRSGAVQVTTDGSDLRLDSAAEAP